MPIFFQGAYNTLQRHIVSYHKRVYLQCYRYRIHTGTLTIRHTYTRIVTAFDDEEIHTTRTSLVPHAHHVASSPTYTGGLGTSICSV